MIDEQAKANIVRVAKQNKLDFVVLFGSVARGTQRSGSDIDIAVFPQDPSVLSLVSEEIGTALKRNDVEVADLSIPSPYLWRAVARDGILLFEEKQGLFSQWRLRAMNLWFDTAPIRARQKQALHVWADQQTK